MIYLFAWKRHSPAPPLGPARTLRMIVAEWGAFVANFVGQSNLGSGRVIDRDGTHLVAEIQGTKVKIPIARSAVTDGDITFGVRPEKVRVMRRS